MIYYFYLEILKNILSLFSLNTINFYYQLTYFLNSIAENLDINILIWSFKFPWLILLYLPIDLKLIHTLDIIINNLNSLIIGFYNIHPFLLYLSFFFIFNQYHYQNKFVILKIKNIFYITSFTFLLGGYWGAGNSVWGYFWVNDIIEHILLFSVILLLLQIHCLQTKQIQYIYLIIFIVLIFFLGLLRLGLLSTRHAFFDSSNLINLIFYWSNFSFLFSILYIKLFLIYTLGWVVGFCIMFYLFFYLLTIIFKNFKLLLLHLVIFILLITWVKYTPHNISFFLKTINQENSILFFQFKTFLTNNFLLITTNYLSILLMNTSYWFNLKFINNLLIYFKYALLCFFYIILLN